MNRGDLDEAANLVFYDRKLADTASGFTLRFSARFMHPKFALLRRDWLGEEDTFPLKSLCARPVKRGVQPLYADSDIYAVKTGTLKNGSLDLEDIQTVSEDFFESVRRRAGLRRNDLLVASTGTGSLGKVDVYDRDELAIADGHISVVRIRENTYEPTLLAYLMRDRLVQWQIEQGLTGSTNQIDIYPHQIESLRLPRLDSGLREELLTKVRRIEAEISASRAALRAPDDIIDQILCSEFGYPLVEHRQRQRLQHFTQMLGTMAAGFTLRNSAKYHHPDFELTEGFFASTPHEPVKAFAAVPIRLGATATRGDLIDEGDAYYVHPGATRKQRPIALEDCHQVTRKFYDTHERRFALRRGDVIVNRSGEALGKVAIYEHDDTPALASDFTMRVRFSERMNPRFAWYFFRSVMFQAQIYRELRGSSVPNVFPSQVERMLFVSCPRERQNELASQITIDLTALDAHHATIESKRSEIVELVGTAIRASRAPESAPVQRG